MSNLEPEPPPKQKGESVLFPHRTFFVQNEKKAETIFSSDFWPFSPLKFPIQGGFFTKDK
jgi:hypothetical protein